MLTIKVLEDVLHMEIVIYAENKKLYIVIGVGYACFLWLVVYIPQEGTRRVANFSHEKRVLSEKFSMKAQRIHQQAVHTVQNFQSSF